MTVHSKYECDVCHKHYNTETEALECEVLDKTCPCQLPTKDYRHPYISFGIHGVYTISTRIDFERKSIRGDKDYDNDRYVSHSRQEIPINFCPFCGRELKKKYESEDTE